tara:strand:- start:605 stop:877 length:273 start_codon:yes stop_codon:yes gene_type:complete
MKFLHEKKKYVEGKNLKDKDVLSEYNKERYLTKKGKIKIAEDNGYVTKNNWELMFGLPCESTYYGNTNLLSKYIKKFGEYQGTHTKKDRR